jgi:hypothetical protein
MSHVLPIMNVFREDIVEPGEDREAILSNAPCKKDGSLVVPKTVESGDKYGYYENDSSTTRRTEGAA